MVESKHQWKAWIYLAPAIVLLLIFTVWPIFNTVRMAFITNYNTMNISSRDLGEELKEAREARALYKEQQKQIAAGVKISEYDIIDPADYPYPISINNFTKVLKYKNFQTCLKNTLLLCVLTVPISTILALLVAVALNSIKPLKKVLQTVFFLPYVTNSIAIGMVFAAMFNMVGSFYGTENEIVETAGIINNIIEFFGGHRINWINTGSSYAANIAVMTIYIVWNALPFKILVLLGGLQNINKQYYDAAKIDGTPKWRILTRITVPLLSPMISYVIITGFIGGFKEYTSIVGIFGAEMGPAGAEGRLNTMVGYIYDSLSSKYAGRASAAALILFAIIFAVTMLNLYVSKKRVHY